MVSWRRLAGTGAAFVSRRCLTFSIEKEEYYTPRVELSMECAAEGTVCEVGPSGKDCSMQFFEKSRKTHERNGEIREDSGIESYCECHCSKR